MAQHIEYWPIDKLVFYARNPRKNDSAVDRMCSSIREFGFKIPVLARSDGTVVDGHLRIKAARRLVSWPGGDTTCIPVILCDEWTDAQVKAFRLMVNRSVTWAAWDEELLALELQELKESDFDLDLTGFDPGEIDGLLALEDDERANVTPPLPESPVSRLGDLWLLGPHRVLCGDATDTEVVARLLAERKPRLMVTDPPYGIELDSEWRDRAGLNGCGPAEASYMKKRTAGHTETSISGDTRADWSEAFELVPGLEVAYVWHASKFTREVLDGLLRIGFLHHQQIIWNKGRTVLTRTHYWFQHEPCWYVRKKNAPWFGKAGQNSTIWDSASPKFIMGASDEDKYDHPTQKPVDLMRRRVNFFGRRLLPLNCVSLTSFVGFTVAFLPPKRARHQIVGKRIQSVMEVIAFLMRKLLFLTCETHRRRLRLDEITSDESLGFVLPMNVNVSLSDLP
jgi:hypothetical protein